MKKLLLLLAAGLFFVSCAKDGETCPDENKVKIVSDNLVYTEAPVGVTKRYFVEVESEQMDVSRIRWYVDGQEKGRGSEFIYTTEFGNHTVSYSVPSGCSVSGMELFGGAAVNIYTTDGVYILNEGSGVAKTRGVNKYLYSAGSVSNFIKGDYESFGVTPQFIANWAGYIYVVSAYVKSWDGNSEGVAFSSFDAQSGDLIKAVKDVNSNNDNTLSNLRAFAGLTPEMGVLTSAKGAYVVTIDEGNFTIGTTPIKGTTNGASSVFVTDGYVFIISDNKALAYSMKGFGENSTPVELGDAKFGFVQSKDGNVWASNGSHLLKINTADLSVSQVTIPVTIESSMSPWKQPAWAASTKENALYFASNLWSAATSVAKYDIETGTFTSDFLTTSDIDNYSYFYSTSLYYDADREELLCSAIKGYGADGAYNGIFSFDDNKSKTSSVLYDTTGSEYGASDMFFPAMMAPIKRFADTAQY